ncbi:hypothetical protein KQI86_05155 [Clostridium sp. MSJ-11]|uniref:Uncharacterized protein n=1 Tax=Clostridium mobile TaxID=2841512 RepID=A0ABS6EER7_9CLOT|nr:hypothetical protein [Clostridium mobile]MBU5483709.1 hypothetical protein [Clostridium mobile]
MALNLNNILVSDYIFLLGCILLVAFAFYRKNKVNDNSFSFKLVSIIKKEYPLFLLLIMSYFIYNYIYMRSKGIELNLNNSYKILWEQWNKLFLNIGFILNEIFKVILNIEVVKVLIIGWFTIKVLFNENMLENFKYIVSQIKEINYKDISIKAQEAESIKNIKEKEIEDIKVQEKEGKIDSQYAEEKIKNAKTKAEVIAIMIDNNEIVKYIDTFINKDSKNIIIPKNLIPKIISLSNLEKLFLFDLTFNSIKLTGIKPEIYNIVKETFDELKNKGIIYCTN